MVGQGFFVIGDFTERQLGEYVSPARRLLVRMFVGGRAFDEEFEVDSLDDLRPSVEERMTQLAKRPNTKTEVERPIFPSFNPGHAVDLPA